MASRHYLLSLIIAILALFPIGCGTEEDATSDDETITSSDDTNGKADSCTYIKGLPSDFCDIPSTTTSPRTYGCNKVKLATFSHGIVVYQYCLKEKLPTTLASSSGTCFKDEATCLNVAKGKSTPKKPDITW